MHLHKKNDSIIAHTIFQNKTKSRRFPDGYKLEFISLTLINSMQNVKCKMQNECVAEGDYFK